MSWINFFRFEIQHIFPINDISDANLASLKALMGDEFDLQQQGNLIAMFADDITARAFQALPPAVQKVFTDAGWGLNRHEGQASFGNHPGYTKFIDDRLTQIFNPRSGLSPEAQKLAFWDLHQFMRKVNQGLIKIDGDVVGVIGPREQATKIKQEFDRVNEDGRPANRIFADDDLFDGTYDASQTAAIDTYKAGFDATKVNGEVAKARRDLPDALIKALSEVEVDGQKILNDPALAAEILDARAKLSGTDALKMLGPELVRGLGVDIPTADVAQGANSARERYEAELRKRAGIEPDNPLVGDDLNSDEPNADDRVAADLAERQAAQFAEVQNNAGRYRALLDTLAELPTSTLDTFAELVTKTLFGKVFVAGDVIALLNEILAPLIEGD